jgi:hypothetical protein
MVLLKTIGPTSMEMLCLEMGVHYIHLWGENFLLIKIMAPLVWESCVWKWGWMYPTLEKKCLKKFSPTNNGILVFGNGGELYSPWEISIFLF